MFSYYRKKIYLPIVDKSGNIIGKEERWKVHKEGILHRGFTVVLIYKNWILAQFRKHLIFDGVFDLSFSSHPYYKKSELIDDKQSILESLKREWKIKYIPKKEKIKFLGKVFYTAKDKNGFREKELDYFYAVKLNELPQPNPDFAYGYVFFLKENFLNKNFYPIPENLIAPWVKSAISKNLFNNL